MTTRKFPPLTADVLGAELRRPRLIRNDPSTALFGGWGPRLRP
jgi:hypothetical protein